MTLDYFRENVETWDELYSACRDFDYYEAFCENDIMTDEELDAYINESIGGLYRDYAWYELRDALSNIPQGYEFYKVYGWDDIVGLDGNDMIGLFEDVKSEVLGYAEEHGLFEAEDEDEEEFIIEEEYLLDPIDEPEDDFDYDAASVNANDVSEFFTESNGIFTVYKKRINDEAKAAEMILAEIEDSFAEVTKQGVLV